MAVAPGSELEGTLETILDERPSPLSFGDASSGFWQRFEGGGLSDSRSSQSAAIRAPSFFATRRRSTKEQFYDVTKRCIDLALATPSFVALAPLLMALGLATKFYDGGPMFFSQVRIGRNGKPFLCYKIRTMVPNADSMKWMVENLSHHADSITFKAASDPRITPLGAILRKASLDELPQLLNVVMGQMSLVGPRPAVPTEVSRYRRRDYLRLLVKPGLTCIWQVSGRGDVDFNGQVSMDLEYVRLRSPWLDAKLIMQTIPAVLSMRGAY